MGNLVNALNELKTNIFGGGPSSGKTTPIIRQSAIEMKDTSPTSKAAVDPFQFSSISYPRDVTNDLQNGHYMLFYVNVQNKTKYRYTTPDENTVGGDQYITNVNEETGEYTVTKAKGSDIIKDKRGNKFSGYKNINTKRNREIAKLHKNKQKRASGLS